MGGGVGWGGPDLVKQTLLFELLCLIINQLLGYCQEPKCEQIRRLSEPEKREWISKDQACRVRFFFFLIPSICPFSFEEVEC